MNTVIELKNVDICFKRDKLKIFNNINLKIYPGDVISISGTNGIGKSTFLKALAHNWENIEVNGNIIFDGSLDIAHIKKNDVQKYRSEIAYIPQEDNYDGFSKATVTDVMLDNAHAFGLNYKKQDIRELFDKYDLRKINKNNKNGSFHENSIPSRLSGGQKRVLSIISELFIRKDSKLFIIDEPLNNLDMCNVKWISNIINKIHLENPHAAIIMVTHCKVFPFINKTYEVVDNNLVLNRNNTCYHCFGEPNREGFYE